MVWMGPTSGRVAEIREWSCGFRIQIGYVIEICKWLNCGIATPIDRTKGGSNFKLSDRTCPANSEHNGLQFQGSLSPALVTTHMLSVSTWHAHYSDNT